MTKEEKVELIKKAFQPFGKTFSYNVVPADIGSSIAIEFNSLHVEQIESCIRFIRVYYTPTLKNKFSRFMFLSPKFSVSQRGRPALILEGNDIEKVFGNDN